MVAAQMPCCAVSSPIHSTLQPSRNADRRVGAARTGSIAVHPLSWDEYLDPSISSASKIYERLKCPQAAGQDCRKLGAKALAVPGLARWRDQWLVLCLPHEIAAVGE